jgi:aminopeptidase YwaD
VNNGNFGSGIISAIEQKVWDVRASMQSVNQAVPFVLYPNPATDQVRIQIEANTHSVTVLDLMGRVVKNNGSESIIDLTGMADGTYLVRIKTPQGEGVSRLIVQ